MDVYQKHEDEFALVLGRAMIAFANIEYFTYIALQNLPNDSICKTAAGLEFCKRLELLIEILKGRNPSEKSTRFIDSLKRCKKLAEKRNLIAHNPLVIQTIENRLTPRIVHVSKATNTITLEELSSFCEEVSGLGGVLFDQFLSMYDASIP